MEPLEAADTKEIIDNQTSWIELIAGEQHNDMVIADAKGQLVLTEKSRQDSLKTFRTT